MDDCCVCIFYFIAGVERLEGGQIINDVGVCYLETI